MSWVVFLMLNAYGKGMCVGSFSTKALASLYAGAFFQLTMGLMGVFFVNFYKASYYWSSGVQGNVPPSRFFWDNVLTFIDGRPDVVL